VVSDFLQSIRRPHPDEGVLHTQASNEGRKQGRGMEHPADDERTPANGPAIGAGQEGEQTGGMHGPIGVRSSPAAAERRPHPDRVMR
jgi:hypothetical protein